MIIQHNHAFVVSPIALIYILLILQVSMPYAQTQDQRLQDALLRFKATLGNPPALSGWDPSTPPCNGANARWVGIICSRAGTIYGLRLENMGLSGRINADAFSGLRQLRTISFMDNGLEGPMPSLEGFKALKSLYLSNNAFGGSIDPDAFSGLKKLRKLLLANNKFSGEIPTSITKLPKLTVLRLEGNQFQGKIPDFEQKKFKDLSLANNRLEGQVPKSLSDINQDAFTGNDGLCGGPLNPCKTTTKPKEDKTPSKPPTPSKKSPRPSKPPTPSKKSPPPSKTSTTPKPSPVLPPPPPRPQKKSSPILQIIVAVAIILLVILLVIAVLLKKRSQRRRVRIQAQVVELPPKVAPKSTIHRDASGKVGGGARVKASGDGGKLCFVREGGGRFDLPDLLRASAEILGSGCFGSSYKASMLNATHMVVKRFKMMNNVRRDEFHQHMRRIGRLQHKNVLSLVAYYYRKEEKLLVSEFVQRGSLAINLHGNRGQASLDWPTRLNIIKGVARGLSYIYNELSPILTAPHGHLKSSNVLLDDSFNPLIHDYGLIPLINQEDAHRLMVAYKSPEHESNGRINKKTDVWALGILIIEIMTGQFPATYLQQEGKVYMSTWIKDVVGNGQGGSQVFDKNMAWTADGEAQMHKLLNIGVTCCESDVGKRWDISEACDRIEEVTVT